MNSNQSIDDEIDSLIKMYAGGATGVTETIKQKEIIQAQNRAIQRIELAKKKEEVAKLKEQKVKEVEKKKKQKELVKKRKREIQTMYCNKRKRLNSKSKDTSKDQLSRKNITDMTNSSKIGESLGHTDPDSTTLNDIMIKNQIEGTAASDDAPGSSSQNSKEKFEFKADSSRSNSDVAKSRYNTNYVNDEEDDDAYDFNVDYGDDFDIENPDDVNVEVCRGKGTDKYIDDQEKEYDDLNDERKDLEDQGGTRISQDQANPASNRVKQLEQQLKSEIDKEAECLNYDKDVTKGFSKPKSESHTPVIQSNYSANYYNPDKHLDGSTVVIADVTPSKDEIGQDQDTSNYRARPVDSVMLSKSTKEKLKMLGQSLDSKHIHQAIGSIDMRRLCKCFAKAISKHIEFSEGFLFLEDLKAITKEIYREHGIEQDQSINFSYGLGKDLAIKFQTQNPVKEVDRQKLTQEGQTKNQANFDKLAGAFGDFNTQKQKEGKVFEYHEKDNEEQKNDEGDFEDEMDYSHAHLEEFMISLHEHNNNNAFGTKTQLSIHKENEMAHNSTLNPEQTNNLISNFLKNVNQNPGINPQSKRSESEIFSTRIGISAVHEGATLNNSLSYSQTNASVKGLNQFNSVNLVSGVKLKQKEQSEQKHLESDQKPVEELKIDDGPIDYNDEQELEDDEELERDDDNQDFYIEVDTPVTNKSAKHAPERTKGSKSEQHISTKQQQMHRYNMDLENNGINPNLLDETNLFESQEVVQIDDRKDYIETQMYQFHFNFDFDIDSMLLDENGDIPSFPFMEYKPTEEEVYYYCKYVLLASKMEKEIPLMALVYIERFMNCTGMLMNHWNWKRIVLTTLIIASKVWDDDSLENIHFPQVMPDISLKEVNT